jgi:hypothetical protein
MFEQLHHVGVVCGCDSKNFLVDSVSQRLLLFCGLDSCSKVQKSQLGAKGAAPATKTTTSGA